MNAPLRKVAFAIMVLLVLIVANLTYIQYFQGNSLRNDSKNLRTSLQEYKNERGAIVVDGAAIALSKETNAYYKYQRKYPQGPLYAPVTGFISQQYGRTGIEQYENSILSGEDDRLFVRRLSDTLSGRKTQGGNVVLTLQSRVQEVAYNSLAKNKGAVVAMNPKTGAILAVANNPSYDPNPLASQTSSIAAKSWEKLNADKSQPALNRALNQTYPPGSTFKVIVSAAALSSGDYSPDTALSSPLRYKANASAKPIENYNGSSCDGKTTSLKRSLTISCNTSFAQLGVKLGPEVIKKQAQKFGFEQSDLNVPMSVATSRLEGESGELSDKAYLAQSSIGQHNVRMTPLQGAMIASAVANQGSLMKPYLVKEVQAPDLTTLSTTKPEELSQAVNPGVANQLTEMMTNVVNQGTGTKAQINQSGIVVAGKTGTAENDPTKPDHAWFIGFVLRNGEPIVAVAVVLENAGSRGDEVTGGKAAAPIARDVMLAALKEA